MRLTGPESYPGLSKRGIEWCVSDADWDADRGADATTIRYQIANPRRHISLRVFLRLTAMDVCCGPPATSLVCRRVSTTGQVSCSCVKEGLHGKELSS
jgi:hypothetical protein